MAIAEEALANLTAEERVLFTEDDIFQFVRGYVNPVLLCFVEDQRRARKKKCLLAAGFIYYYKRQRYLYHCCSCSCSFLSIAFRQLTSVDQRCCSVHSMDPLTYIGTRRMIDYPDQREEAIKNMKKTAKFRLENE